MDNLILFEILNILSEEGSRLLERFEKSIKINTIDECNISYMQGTLDQNDRTRRMIINKIIEIKREHKYSNSKFINNEEVTNENNN